MSETAAAIAPPPVLQEQVPSQEKTLRRLFLLLFLRGRGARGLNKQGVPKTVVEKLALTIVFYGLFGCMALMFVHQPVFALAVYTHAMTFVFLGMFVASSAGEVLFNKEEANILMHRPVAPRTMLWAKIRVLVEVSLWLAGAFNLVGLFVGFSENHNWRFPLAHIVSTFTEALFCTGCVVLIYQLCLRWFGRERLEGLMTTAQVLISVGAVLAGQILTLMVFRYDHVLDISKAPWWIGLLPPAWFAGFDDALAGTGSFNSWLLAAFSLVITATVLWLAFGKLAASYEAGLQALNETVSSRPKNKTRRRWLDRLVEIPPLSWWLRHPVARASFLLTTAYLMRDRDVKLRMYPGIAPILIVPFIFLLQGNRHDQAGFNSFGILVSGIYLGMVPLLALQILQYSQQWLAADIFRIAPLSGPAEICHGARRAVMCLLTLPMLAIVGLVVCLLSANPTKLVLLLPGIISLPVFALVPHLGGKHVPLSVPADAAKAAGRGFLTIFIMFLAMGLAGLASLAFFQGWYWWLVFAEAILAITFYFIFRIILSQTPWPSEE